jgi:hypothetical protein
MDREDIYRRVIEVAERFGPGNPQEVKLLSSQLTKCEAAEVFAGLLLVFSRSVPTEANYPKQELAGRMLEKAESEGVHRCRANSARSAASIQPEHRTSTSVFGCALWQGQSRSRASIV